MAREQQCPLWVQAFSPDGSIPASSAARPKNERKPMISHFSFDKMLNTNLIDCFRYRLNVKNATLGIK